MADDRYRLYRYFDLDGVLLYVGLTQQAIAARHRQHFFSALWWARVSRLDVKELPAELTYEQAELAEARAVQDEHPVYNHTHQASDNRRRVRLVSSPNRLAYLARLDRLAVEGREWRAAAEPPKPAKPPAVAKRKRAARSSGAPR